MQIGAVFPGDELRYVTDEIDEWIAAVADTGFDHVTFGDHIVGADPERAAPGWDKDWPNPGRPAYTFKNIFNEPLVLFGYLAAKCDLELVTGIVILPQRQTVLVAKQGADVD